MTMTKTLKIPNDRIYLVAYNREYEGAEILAAFKSEKAAQKFVDACKKLFEQDEDAELRIGKHVVDKYDIDAIEVLDHVWSTGSNEVPFFNK